MSRPRKVDNSYWTKRFAQLEAQYHGDSEAVFRALEREYSTAAREVQDAISAWYLRYAKNNSLTLVEARKQLAAAELAELKWTIKEYIKYGQENALSGKWMAQLERASARVHISRYEALKLQMQHKLEVLYASEEAKLAAHAKHVLDDGYLRTAYTIQKGTGVGSYVQPLDPDRIKRIVSKPWAPDGSNFSDRIWTNKGQMMNTLETELSQMLIRGEAPDRAIKEIANRFNVSKSQAGNLVMTESAYFASESQRQVFNELGIKKYRVIAALDELTCDKCGGMDQMLIPENERVAGVTAPPFHPRCRCTTIPGFEDMDDWGANRAARNIAGNYIEVPANSTFEQWKKEHSRAPAVARIVGITAANGATIKIVASHFFDQMWRGYSVDDAIDALHNPLHITQKVYKDGLPSYQFIGRHSTVAYNPDIGKITSCWPTSSKRVKRYSKK